MDAARILRLVRAHLQRLGGEWALAGGFAFQALGFSRFTRDLDLVVDEGLRNSLLAALTADGFEILFTSPGYSNLLHPDPDLGRVDLIWLEGETSTRFFAGCRDSTIMRCVVTSKSGGFPASSNVSRRAAEGLTLDLDVAFRATEEERAALRRHRPAPATFDEYCRFLSSFPSTREELEAIPLSKGRRFRLD